MAFKLSGSGHCFCSACGPFYESGVRARCFPVPGVLMEGNMISDTVVRKKLKSFILKEILRNPAYPMKPDEPLISGGLIDSFSVVQIAVFVEETFGIVIPDAELTVEDMDTLNQMVALVLNEKRS
ncbi:MAG: hypothetical protein DRJ08_04330 [Acidobacteria bacterium]|nr:MAG: hypothetical protein DRJ08_04330 [Acidobacteriota bacterium]